MKCIPAIIWLSCLLLNICWLSPMAAEKLDAKTQEARFLIDLPSFWTTMSKQEDGFVYLLPCDYDHIEELNSFSIIEPKNDIMCATIDEDRVFGIAFSDDLKLWIASVENVNGKYILLTDQGQVTFEWVEEGKLAKWHFAALDHFGYYVDVNVMGAYAAAMSDCD